MPTKRYRHNGGLTIAMTLLDAESHDGRAQYACRIAPTGDRKALPWTGTVCGPVFTSEPSDSPAAFERTANAALSFAEHEGFPCEAYSAFPTD